MCASRGMLLLNVLLLNVFSLNVLSLNRLPLNVLGMACACAHAQPTHGTNNATHNGIKHKQHKKNESAGSKRERDPDARSEEPPNKMQGYEADEEHEEDNPGEGSVAREAIRSSPCELDHIMYAANSYDQFCVGPREEQRREVLR